LPLILLALASFKDAIMFDDPKIEDYTKTIKSQLDNCLRENEKLKKMLFSLANFVGDIPPEISWSHEIQWFLQYERVRLEAEIDFSIKSKNE